MIKFPMKFEVEASAAAPITSHWTCQTDKLPPIPVAIPPEFMGPGGGYSPEDLFGLAVLNCVIAMFKVYCAKSKLTFRDIQGKAVLTADKDPAEPSFFISHIDLHLNVAGASDVEKVRKILEEAIKHCPISNSIKSGKSFHCHVS